MNTPIIRIPIKLRKPIHKDFCNCWDIKVFSVEGVPYLILADHLSLEDLERYLDTLTSSVGFYFSSPIEECMEKVMLVLNRKLPVTIKTNTTLPDIVLNALSEV